MQQSRMTPSRVTPSQLLAASQTHQQSWAALASDGPMKLLPYVGIGEEQYSTYLRTS
jgi:hypothetical protein